MNIRSVIRFSALTLLWLAALPALAATPLVDDSWLLANMQQADVVVDLQSSKGFQRAHIPGAVNTDYGRWRTGPRTPMPKVMPSVQRLESMIGALGIDNTSHVVLVPFGQSAGDMAAAARIYWTFKALGHERVSILEGGLVGYARGGRSRALAQGPARPAAKSFKASPRPEFILTKAQVKQALEAGVALVDNRSRAEYLGVYRAGGKERPGTIPGSVNLPYEWLTVNGSAKLHSPEDLRALYNAMGVPLEGAQISFCHTGHRTALGWFVSHELLGNKQARLYDGSMAEWAVDSDLPMETRVEWQCKAC